MQEIFTDYPTAFLRNMRELLGEAEYEEFMRALSPSTTAALRINSLRENGGTFDFMQDAVPWEPLGRYIFPGHKAGQDLRHFSGAYYMQDASAMAPAAVLRAEPGERVLDLCAAPGGKAGQLAAQMRGAGLLMANEPDAKRAAALSGNLERLGVYNAVVTCALPQELSKRFPEYFDALLVDAPCSGEGMFRRDMAARAEWSEQSPTGCASRQAVILEEAAKLLKPGGRMVYSTCTFNAIENEGVVEAFLASHGDFYPEDFALNGVGVSEKGMLRLWPHKLRGEGHFVALLRKTGEREKEKSLGEWRGSKDIHSAFELLCRAALREWPERFGGMRFVIQGDRLIAVPEDCPDMRGVRVSRHGLHLCRIGKGYVQPDHALAMVLLPGEAAQMVELDETRANAFVRGQALGCDAAIGWTLVCYRGMPLGWGKASDGVLKNHIPKGIRLLS